jgi:hypothetical protein
MLFFDKAQPTARIALPKAGGAAAECLADQRRTG